MRICTNRGIKHGAAEQHRTQDEIKEHGGGEVAVLEQLQLENGMRVPPFVKYEGDQRDHGEREKDGDVGGAEPVFLLALVEDDLQEAEADDDQRQADVIDLDVLALDCRAATADLRPPGGEEEGEQADGDVDEENPAPVVIVGDPAAESGADGRGDDDRHAEDGEGLAALLGREGVREDGLFAGAHASSAGALQDAEENEEGQRRREAAEE